MKTVLTQSELHELAFYDPLTGEFRRKDLSKALPNISSRGYYQISIKNQTCLVHRLAWLYVYGKWPDQVIDHIDGNRVNNRITNLRDVSSSVNNQNRHYANSSSKSGILGVNFHPPLGKWRARLRCEGRSRHIGYFETPELAHAAYLQARNDSGIGSQA